jgi:hypothetical protein
MWNACRRRCFRAFINTMMTLPSLVSGAAPVARADSEGPVPVDCKNGTLGVDVLNDMVNRWAYFEGGDIGLGARLRLLEFGRERGARGKYLFVKEYFMSTILASRVRSMVNLSLSSDDAQRQTYAERNTELLLSSVYYMQIDLLRAS